MKKFRGFNPEQTYKLLQKLGYDGPKDSTRMEDFLKASPDAAGRMGKYTQRAQDILTNENLKLAEGGLVEGVPSSMQHKGVVFKGNAQEVLARVEALAEQYPDDARAQQLLKLHRGNVQAEASKALTNPQKLLDKPKTIPMAVNSQQFVAANAGQAKDVADATTTTAKGRTVAAPKVKGAVTYDPTLVAKAADKVAKDLSAVTGSGSSQSKVGPAATSKVDVENALGQFQAQTADPSKSATVKGQLESLMEDFEGDATPPWASGAMRSAMAVMQQRGLGASSIAGQAIVTAAMESAIAVAGQDAQIFAQFESQNLANRQSTEQFKATSRIEGAFRDQGATNRAKEVDAQTYAQFELQSMSNEQQSAIFKTQVRASALLSDQAAANAAEQFNASSENQVNQFKSSLQQSIRTFNAAQVNAIRSMNGQEANATKRLNKQMKEERTRFNAQNSLLVAQANAQWRQNIATVAHQANQDATMTYVKSTYGLTEAALDNIWQTERDYMAFAFQGDENQAQRDADLLLAEKEIELAKWQTDRAEESAEKEAIGSLFGNIIGGLF